MSSVFLYILLAFILYQLIFKFIIPIYRTTRQVKRSFREMKERMHGHQTQNGFNPTPEPEKQNDNIKGDYIDFEEVK
jgi:hypothetical protein